MAGGYCFTSCAMQKTCRMNVNVQSLMLYAGSCGETFEKKQRGRVPIKQTKRT